jgi:hypothetical protein
MCQNPWLTAGLGRDEVRVSRVLAALWDRRHYGDEARAFLGRFFAVAGSEFPDSAELARGYRVETEHCINGTTADRVDITIETDVSIIGIEVKVGAIEGHNQLARYAAAIKTRARLMQRANHSVIFLSPYASKEAVFKESDRSAIWVTWQTVAGAASVSDSISYTGWLISQFGIYCRRLGS